MYVRRASLATQVPTHVVYSYVAGGTSGVGPAQRSITLAFTRPDRPANRRPERAFARGPIISSGMATRLLSRVIADGRLPIGSELYHASRLHPERAVTGRVVSGGIEVNGQVYPSPSTAARAVTHSAAENGWTWWRVRDTGRPLAELRDQR